MPAKNQSSDPFDLSNFIDFKCPHCGQPVSFPEDYVGLAQECAECREVIVVPAAGVEFGSKLPIPITTPRLTLRRLQADDWKDFLEYYSDPEMYRYYDGETADERTVIRWLKEDTNKKITQPDERLCLVMELQATSKVLGNVSVEYSDPPRCLQAQIMAWVNPAFQRQGYATEALQAVVAFCFEGIGLHRVCTFCDSRNSAALRMLEKVGLRREGEFLKEKLVHGEWADTVWFAVLREEYFEQKKHAPPLRGGC